jgi:hypothetical protein
MTSELISTRAVVMSIAVLSAAMVSQGFAAPPPAPLSFEWSTVVNNNDVMPETTKKFNSYNQPSVNVNGLVVIRARSKGGQGVPGGGQPIHGIYTRNMSVAGSPIVRILDRTTEVPQPNNLGTLFVETPSFPRIDMTSNTIATRGNHEPVWNYVTGIDPITGENIETRAGTTGIYTNPFGELITGAAKLGAVPDFGFFAVPGLDPPTMFDVFPGAPAVTKGSTIVFKGNYTVDDVGKTGVFFRDLKNRGIPSFEGVLAPAAGVKPVVMIANNTDTVIPGTDPPVIFGSTSPPSAAGPMVVFAGFDNEEAPTLGGIYLAPISQNPLLTPLVSIGEQVPGQLPGDNFNGLGEGGAFDGRYVGFWGAWGTETRTVRLYCPTEGNKDRIAYCNQNLVCEDTNHVPPVEKDMNSICDDTSDPYYSEDPDVRICYQEKEVPVHQGIFVTDANFAHSPSLVSTRAVATTGSRFDEFLFWNYSGKVPCMSSGGHGEEGAEDDGEPARWRSSAFVAVSGIYTAFKARTGELVDGVYMEPPVDGIYLDTGPGQETLTVLDTTMDGSTVDPDDAPVDSMITELGLEREGLRGNWLAVTATMGTEEEGMAGVYITPLPRH